MSADEYPPIVGTFTLHERGLSSPPLPYDAPAEVVNAARIELHERANRRDAVEHPFSGKLSPAQEAELDEMMRRLNTQEFGNPTDIEPPEDETRHG